MPFRWCPPAAETSGHFLTLLLHNSFTLSAKRFCGASSEGQSVWRPTILSRRYASRIEDAEHVWVLWQCDGRDVISPVQNLSTRGLFIETPTARSVGAVSKLGLLVPEGQIRAEAVVRHAQPDRGLGLKFNVNEDDRPRLAALLSRLRSLSRS